jgi:hypothetical protein
LTFGDFDTPAKPVPPYRLEVVESSPLAAKPVSPYRLEVVESSPSSPTTDT